MQIGVVFPQTEIGAAVDGVRAYGLRVEELGFQHVLVYDHVLGADPEVHKPWSGPYNVHTTFHEPFVLFGYYAAITSLELVTGTSSFPSAKPRSWPSRPRRWICSPAAGSASASASAGTPSNTRRSARISRTEGHAWTSRSRCSDDCGPSRL